MIAPPAEANHSNLKKVCLKQIIAGDRPNRHNDDHCLRLPAATSVDFLDKLSPLQRRLIVIFMLL
jgi:hypothetical protein